MTQDKAQEELIDTKITEILEAWQDAGTNYILEFDFGALAIEIRRAIVPIIQSMKPVDKKGLLTDKAQEKLIEKITDLLAKKYQRRGETYSRTLWREDAKELIPIIQSYGKPETKVMGR